MRRWSMSVTSLPSTESNMALSGKVAGFKPLWVWAFDGADRFFPERIDETAAFLSSLKRQHRDTSGMEISPGENSMRYGGNSSSMVRAACISAVAKPSVNRP
jgi:hypothetical protein